MCIQDIMLDFWKEENTHYVCAAWAICRETLPEFDKMNENEKNKHILLKYLEIKDNMTEQNLELLKKYNYGLLSNGVKTICYFYNDSSFYCPVDRQSINELKYLL